MSQKKITVFVGVSGGVDSSVALALLKKQGYDVVGVFIRTWQPDWIECTWKEDRRDAMRVCAHVQVPFVELNLEEAYKKGVADYMIAEYRAGRTPNPDVMCNKEVKFGAFLDWAQQHGADYIATGHYAQVKRHGDIGKSKEAVTLHRSQDLSKDQSYFLWTLTQQQLHKTLFPIGHLQKKEVRNLAEKFGLPTAQKKDSQGICFIGKISMKDFLSHFIDEQPGYVVNQQGRVIGRHPGALFFTLGERHGFEITEKGTNEQPYYVIKKDIHKNELIVAHRSDLEVQKDHSRKIMLSQTNWIGDNPLIQKKYTGQIRYHGEPKVVRIESIAHDVVSVELLHDDSTIAFGQSLVMYDEDRCIGGGVIENFL